MTPSSMNAAIPEPANSALIAETKVFRDDCLKRYRFNNTWDIVLSTAGILLSIAVVAAGFIKRPEVSAILGAVVGAIVTAQKAFPFGQRASFYRLLIGQADNLSTRITQHLWNTQQAVDFLSTLRMDFAQELPRGTGTTHEGAGTVTSKAAPPDAEPSAPEDKSDPAAEPKLEDNEPTVDTQPSGSAPAADVHENRDVLDLNLSLHAI